MIIAGSLRRGFVMDRVIVDLENCYGIKALKQEFDFSRTRAYAIYAPNGAMKSSFAATFQDIANDRESKDRIFAARETVRKIRDETGQEVDKEKVLVVEPYDAELAHTEKTSTLLVDAKLRTEYARLNAEIEKAKSALLAAITQQAGSKKNFEEEISSTFTRAKDAFYTAVTRIKKELHEQKVTPFATVAYDKIFDEKVVSALQTKDLKSTIEDCVRRYNELLSA